MQSPRRGDAALGATVAVAVMVLMVCAPVARGDDWPASGTPMQVFDCGAGSPAQHHQVWTYNATAHTITLGFGSTQPPSPLCIDCQGCGDGQANHLWSCSPQSPNPNQVWTVNAAEGTVVSKTTGNCMTAAVPADGSVVETATCKKDDPRQQFTWDTTTGALTFAGVKGLCVDTGSQFNVSCTTPPLNAYPYCNPDLPAAQRAADLASRISVAEIASMLQNTNNGIPRLAVPQYGFNEALHGVVTSCGAAVGGNTGCPTSFPHATALGATFNRSLWGAVGSTISTEGRALWNTKVAAGITFWAPDINLFRDPRWGRGQETPGEDPFLTSEYIRHWGRGFQGDDESRYLKAISTGKHFMDYDLENWGGYNRVSFNAVVPDKDQVEYYWPAWRAAFQGAHIQSSMCSYNAVNGVPSCANDFSMNQVARATWGFDGFFVSDCGAISGIQNSHHYTSTPEAAVAAGIKGGCDVNCGSYYAGHLEDSVNAGLLSKVDMQQAATRMFKSMFMLGIMDPPAGNPYSTLGAADVDTPLHRQLALEAAQQAIVLLKNDGGVLPVSRSTSIAVVGPHFNATQDMLSIYRGTNTLVNSHSPLQALKAAGANIVGAAPGCDIECNSTVGFGEATAAAAKADVVFVFVGLHPGQGGGPAREDEGWDRTNLTLPGMQEQLVQAVAATGKKVVLVLINGGPLAIEWSKDNVPAIVEAFYPGELGGDAVASVLLGDVSPSGKLPYTVYPADFVARNMTNMQLSAEGGTTYLYYTGAPLFEFGAGLSYTTFSYKWSSVSGGAARAHVSAVRDTPPMYTVTVTNTGKVTSDAVVLAFVTSTDPDAPLRELFGYDRAHALAPGKSATFTFTVPPEVLALVDDAGTMAVRPGQYGIRIGDAQAGVTGTLQVEGEQPLVLFSMTEVRAKAAAARRS